MPRRRMIDPDFWSDSKVKYLTLTERLFLLGLISHADDEGKIQANPAFLRSIIFPYDDFNLEQIETMRTHIIETNPNVQLYENGTEKYIYFQKWSRYQKPSHPQPSKLPNPPKLQESFSEPFQESGQPETGIIPSQVSLGQSSLGKVRLGQGEVRKSSENHSVSASSEDFTEHLSSEKDLTDFLTTVLTKYIPRGPTFMMPSVCKLWLQVRGQEIDKDVFAVLHEAMGKYPLPILAISIVKAVKYSEGKHKPAKYIQTILQEQMKEYEKEHKP